MHIVSNFHPSNAQGAAAAQVVAIMEAEAEQAPNRHSSLGTLQQDPAISALLSVALPSCITPEQSSSIVQAGGSYRDLLHMTEMQIIEALIDGGSNDRDRRGMAGSNASYNLPPHNQQKQQSEASMQHTARALMSFLHNSQQDL